MDSTSFTFILFDGWNIRTLFISHLYYSIEFGLWYNWPPVWHSPVHFMGHCNCLVIMFDVSAPHGFALVLRVIDIVAVLHMLCAALSLASELHVIQNIHFHLTKWLSCSWSALHYAWERLLFISLGSWAQVEFLEASLAIECLAFFTLLRLVNNSVANGTDEVVYYVLLQVALISILADI